MKVQLHIYRITHRRGSTEPAVLRRALPIPSDFSLVSPRFPPAPALDGVLRAHGVAMQLALRADIRPSDSRPFASSRRPHRVRETSLEPRRV